MSATRICSPSRSRALTRLQFLGLSGGGGPGSEQDAIGQLAPRSGPVRRVGRTFQTVTPGETVAAGKPLFVVGGVTEVHFELANSTLPTHTRFGSRHGGPVHARLRPGVRGPGDLLVHLLPEVDPTTHKIWAHAEAKNPDGRLKPNGWAPDASSSPTCQARRLFPRPPFSRTGTSGWCSSGTGRRGSRRAGFAPGCGAMGSSRWTPWPRARRSSPPVATPCWENSSDKFGSAD